MKFGPRQSVFSTERRCLMGQLNQSRLAWRETVKVCLEAAPLIVNPKEPFRLGRQHLSQLPCCLHSELEKPLGATGDLGCIEISRSTNSFAEPRTPGGGRGRVVTIQSQLLSHDAHKVAQMNNSTTSTTSPIAQYTQQHRDNSIVIHCDDAGSGSVFVDPELSELLSQVHTLI
jgi:hypothetical protein